MACNKITPHLDPPNQSHRRRDQENGAVPGTHHGLLRSARHFMPSDRNAPMMVIRVCRVLNEHLPPHYAVAEMSDGAIVRVA